MSRSGAGPGLRFLLPYVLPVPCAALGEVLLDLSVGAGGGVGGGAGGGEGLVDGGVAVAVDSDLPVRGNP